MKKTLISSILPLLIIAGFISSTFQATAEHFYSENCQEIVQYYNPSLPESNGGNNTAAQHCPDNHHEEYPGAHIEEINLNEHLDPSKDKHQPWSVHRHRFTNESIEEIGVEGKNIYKLALIESVEFHLEDDFVENVDLNDIVCSGLPDWNNCVGEGILAKTSDGLYDIGYEVSFDKENKTIKWHFPGTDHEGWRRLALYGENPELGEIMDIVDTTQSINRSIETFINFKTKSIEEEAWSASVTSRALIKHYTATMDPNIAPTGADWIPFPATADEPGEHDNYFWHNIGTTTTIWEREIIPPNVCTDLDASRDPNGTAKLNGTEYGHKLKVNNLSFENEVPAGAQILWESTDPDGRFWMGEEGHDSGTWIDTGMGALLFQYGKTTTDANNLDQYVYYFGEGPVNVSIDPSSIDPEEMDSEACNAVIYIPNIEPSCDDLNVDHPANIYDGTLSEFRASALDNDGDLFPGPIHYSVDSGYGFFYVEKPDGLPANPSAQILETFNWEKVMTGALWSDFGLIEPTPMDLSIMGQTNSFGLELQPDIHTPLVKLGDPQETKLGFDITGPAIGFDDDILQFLSTSATVMPGDKVYFFALKPGTDVIHVKASNAGEDQCERSFSIVPFNVCQDIFVNHQKPIYKDTISEFSAKALNPVGDNFYGNITYSVDPEYGTFYLYKPGSPELNDALHVKEYDSSSIVPSPEGGFCSDGTGSVIGPEVMPDTPEVILPKVPGIVLGEILIEQGAVSAIDTTFSILTGEAEKESKKFVHPEDKQSMIYEVPDWIESGIIPDKSPIDPSPEMGMSMGQISVIGSTLYDPITAEIPHDFDLSKTVTGGYEFYANGQIYGSTLTVSPNTKVYFHAKKAGENAIEVSANCTVNQDCIQYFDIIEEPVIDYVCTDISPQIINLETNEQTQTIQKDSVYSLQNTTSFESLSPENPTSNFSTTQGILFQADSAEDALFTIAILREWGDISSTNGMYDDLHEIYNVPDGETVYLLTFSDAAPGPNALTIEASNTEVAECKTSFTLIEDSPCSDVIVNYYPSPFDSSQSTIFSIQEGDFGNYQGNFTVESSNNNGEFYFPTVDELHGNPMEFTQDQISQGIIYENGGTSDTVTIYATGEPNGGCTYEITSNPGGEDWDCIDLDIITPSGTWNEDDLNCDSDDEDCYQKFRIDADTSPSGYENQLEFEWDIVEDGDLNNLEWRNGDSHDGTTNYLEEFDLEDLIENLEDGEELEIEVSEKNTSGNKCTDTIKFRTEDSDEPEIEKLIYDPNDTEWANKINMSGRKDDGSPLNSKEKTVSYLAVFDPGSYESVKISEESIKNGKIIAENTNDGFFDFQGLTIIISDEVAYMSNDFDENIKYHESDDYIKELDEINDNLGIDNNIDYIDFDEYDKDDNDEFLCDENDNRTCIENSENKIATDFEKGDPIEFNNISENDNIYIIYQMINKTEITDDYCKYEIGESGDCGEEFKNEINFKAYSEDDFDGSTETGDDSATVIVICPYILTREGGDSFFHSAFDTGVDVAACYDIETCEGPCIKKKKKPKKEIPKTGMDENGNPIPAETQVHILEAPSHDVCKISNTTDSNIEGYQNVLKNFSSSVCEMEVDVAKEWKEKYINEAIEANVEKLSRFSSQSKTTLSQVEPGTSSGVYVVDGEDLTIENTGDFMIHAIGGTPAAQTYIVKNADLIINSNIKYDDSSVVITNPKTIPSVAFIVINGNIQISNDVEQLDGIYMAIDTDDNPDGEIRSAQNTPTFEYRLTINGSLIGNVLNLYTNRRAIGNILKDEGSITIRYDERILLNTPPGLSDIFNLTQSGIAH